MNKRKTIKGYKTLIPSSINVDNDSDTFKDGIIYTLYCDDFNSLKVGFAENDKVLEKKLSSEALIILDIKKRQKERSMFINNHSKRTWHQIFRQFLFQILKFFNETFIYFRLARWKITL